MYPSQLHKRGGYVRIGSVRVRVRQDGAGVGDEGEEEDCCCGVGRSGGRKEPVAVPTPDRNSVQSRDRHSCAPTGCNPWQHYSKLERREREPPPATALDRLPRLRLGGPERPGSRHHKKKPRSSDKTERLRELTEKLKAPAKAEAAPPPSPAPAAPAEPPPSAARTPTSDELFEVNLNLAKPESRTIVGSYIQRTIPFRSASFSQVDFSSADGKYIRNARNAAVANKAGASLSLPRKKLSEGCRTVVYSDGIPAASDLSIDSAVGSEEWSIPEELPAIGDDSEQCKSGRSLTHPLGARRGSRPDRDLPYSSIDGNGLKSLQTTSGSGERPPLEGVKEESDADSAAATSDAASSSAGVRDRLTDHELTSDWVRSIPDERPPASPEPEKPEAPSAYEVISEEQQEKTLEIDRENGNCEDDLIAVDEKTENKRENDLSSNGDEKIVNEVTPERVTVETPLCDVDKKNPEINTQLTVTVATTNNGVSSPSGGVEFAPGIIYPSSAQEEPQSPEEFSRPRWPHHGRRRPGLVCQSSEEKDEDAEGSPGGPCRLGHRRHSPTRTDSLSEGESDNGRPLTPTNRDRTSPSLFGPSDQSDCECRLARGAQHTRRYSKRPLRGPYGQMLEAEMKKPEAGKFSKHNDDLKFLEEYVQPNRENRAADDIRIGSTCNSLSPPSERHGPATPVTLKPTPKRKVSANIPYSAPEPTATSADQALLVHHQRTTSSPSQLEGCSNQKQEAFLAHLLKGSSERSLTEPSTTPLLTSQRKDTRTHVVVELYDIEKSYVESLQILVMKYLQPLKSSENAGLIDAGLVDEIFYQVPSILAHHEVFLEELRKRLENWDINQRVGDLILETFTKQSVIDTYTAFINNWKNAKDAVKTASQSKPAFARFLESMARENKGKLDLDSLLIMPVQRIPRYELLIQALLKHTDPCHIDVSSLLEAQHAVHNLAISMNLGQHKALNPRGSNYQELIQLESLIEGLAGLCSPDRTFLSHDQVVITTSQGRKDRALFLFSDLLVITSIKRRSGTIRKPSQNCPGSIVNTLEANKYKLLMKIPLDDLEIVKVKDDNVRRMLKEMEQLTADVATLSQMAELVATLHCPHTQLEESVREMLAALNKQLTERHAADSQLSYLELMINTQNGIENIAVIFSKPEKRTCWEEIFSEAKQRLALSGEKRITPELVSAVPIRKTRAGLQFTCAAPTCGPGARDVWVCNSDGYVGQVCVLSLHPEPTVTSCNGVCNARILCISPVPGPSGNESSQTGCNCNSGISISVEDTDKGPSNIQLDSSSSSDEEEKEEDVENCISDNDCIAGTMWLGTEDGCVHVYNSTDNIRTKKNKIKIQHGAPVHTIIYLENRVFISLANGDITVYVREQNGAWNTSDAVTLSVGSAAMPVTKMVPISGRLWCSCHTTIKILNTSTLLVEHSFVASGESGRSVTCIAASGLSVWVSLHNSATVRLFHATTYEWLAEVNVAPAVTKMLACCDDIIRQHKAACLRVTSLLACKDLLWVGTSAGVILTMPLPQVLPTTSKITSALNVTGVPHGHTGHVRFLTTVESNPTLSNEHRRHSGYHGKLEPGDLLVISGGDGYEDFRSASVSEIAGREDSTNHLLLWQV